jgi:hypothetical protein
MELVFEAMIALSAVATVMLGAMAQSKKTICGKVFQTVQVANQRNMSNSRRTF